MAGVPRSDRRRGQRAGRARRIVTLALLFFVAACAARPGGEARVAFSTAAITARAASGHAAPDHAFTPATVVRVASVSKLVTTIGAMRLVEAGVLDLDRDVSTYLGWPLRNPAFPDAPVTLRHLLSHTSSLADDGDDYAVPLGRSLRAAIGPRNWLPHAPGTWFRYTNYNLPVVATVMEAATGERFDRLMARLVLTPLGLDACYNWTTCPDRAVARAGVLYRDGTPTKDDLRGRRPECPVNVAPGGACDLAAYRPGTNGALFSPQGGLRISTDGLATIGRLLLGAGIVDGVRLLSPTSVAQMRAPQWRWTGDNGDTEDGLYCAWGLGLHLMPDPRCRDDLFGVSRARFGHSGEAYGLRSGLWLDGTAGVAFVASAAGSAPGRSAFTRVEERLAGDDEGATRRRRGRRRHDG